MTAFDETVRELCTLHGKQGHRLAPALDCHLTERPHVLAHAIAQAIDHFARHDDLTGFREPDDSGGDVD